MKEGTIFFKKTKGGLKLGGDDLWDIYSTTGVPPYKILELFKEQIKKEYELEAKHLDELIEVFKHKI